MEELPNKLRVFADFFLKQGYCSNLGLELADSVPLGRFEELRDFVGNFSIISNNSFPKKIKFKSIRFLAVSKGESVFVGIINVLPDGSSQK